MVKQSVDSTLITIGKNPQLKVILEKLLEKQESYIAEHTVILAHVSCALAVAMDWSSTITFEKLAMAAFFHDISIENDNLCRIKTLNELEESNLNFSENARIQFKSHPTEALSLIEKISEAPSEVGKIVIEHHEDPRGTGFPNELLGPSIAPLSAIFIIAHDIVDYFFEHEENVTLGAFLDAYSEKYRSGNFRKIAIAVNKIAVELKTIKLVQ